MYGSSVLMQKQLAFFQSLIISNWSRVCSTLDLFGSVEPGTVAGLPDESFDERMAFSGRPGKSLTPSEVEGGISEDLVAEFDDS